MRTISGLCAVLMLLAPCAFASTTAISIDSIAGVKTTPGGDITLAGNYVGFRLRYTNSSDSGFNITNGWIISSPDGATWTDSALGGNFRGANLGPIGIDTTGLLSKAQFPSVYALRTFSTSGGTVAKADGLSPDTVTFSGVGMGEGQGLPPHFDARVFTIWVNTNPADLHKNICLDSTSNFTPTNRWKWAVLYGGPMPDSAIPTWSGIRCVRLVSRLEFTGETLSMMVCPTTISGSHCGTFTYNFDASLLDTGLIQIRYGLVSGPGSIDSLTGVWAASQLATGSHTIVVRVVDRLSGVYSDCTVNVLSTNTAPQFSAASIIVPAKVGETKSCTLSVTNDCDVLTFGLVDDDGAEGPVVLDSARGILSFTPTANDSARTEPVTMIVSVADGQGGSDVISVTWRLTRNCFGTVGNVDCDPNELVDIADLTLLIDYLFISFKTPCSWDEANINGYGIIDLSDLTALISHLFVTFIPLRPCP